MKRILVALEELDFNSKVLEKTIQLASVFSSRVCILHCETPSGEISFFQLEEDLILNENDIIQHNISLRIIKNRLEDLGIETDIAHLKGTAINKILEKAKNFKADLIITGYHPKYYFSNLFVKSLEEELLKQIDIPLLIVPHKN